MVVTLKNRSLQKFKFGIGRKFVVLTNYKYKVGDDLYEAEDIVKILRKYGHEVITGERKKFKKKYLWPKNNFKFKP